MKSVNADLLRLVRISGIFEESLREEFPNAGPGDLDEVFASAAELTTRWIAVQELSKSDGLIVALTAAHVVCFPAVETPRERPGFQEALERHIVTYASILERSETHRKRKEEVP